MLCGGAKWSSHRSCPSSPCSGGHSCPEEQESGPGCAPHHAALLPELARSWELCTCTLHRAELRHPQPHTHPYKTMHRPVTRVQGKPKGLSREVPSASKGRPDCALVGTSKPLPSCQWDTSSPWLHFLSASPQVQGWEANSQAISIFNADQGCVGAACWDIHTGSAEQAGGAGEAHQPPVNRQR